MYQNLDGSTYFRQSWENFKSGFGMTTCNYWLGNELIHQLTKNGRYKARFDLQAKVNKKWYRAEYSTFIVYSKTTKYRLKISGYSGNAGNAMINHNNAKFTTFDRDNDNAGRNCAKKRGGGFWWNDCGRALVTASQDKANHPFSWKSLPKNDKRLLKGRIWLMCR